MSELKNSIIILSGSIPEQNAIGNEPTKPVNPNP